MRAGGDRKARAAEAIRGRGRLAIGLALGVLAGCAHNPGVPRFRTARPAPLPAAAAPRPEESVRVELQALPWWTVAGTPEHFILAFDQVAGTEPDGRRLGQLRSRDVPLFEEDLDAVRCAWMIVPMGDPRPCPDMRRAEAMAASRGAIESARSDLRTQAGALGAGVVGDVRCFAERSRPGAAHLWCEGVAIAGATPDAPGNPAAGATRPDPAAPIDRAPRTPGSRLVLHADGSVGMLGRRPIVGSTFGLRYRPFELGFDVLDLQRERLAPMEGGLVGLGVTALGRLPLGTSRADVLAGLSAVAVAQNGATNPDFDGLYVAFAGLAYQSRWRLAGVAQPFVQLRAGVARGTELAGAAAPFLGLHLGLSTPERR